jgi:adenylate kinase family enzyme
MKDASAMSAAQVYHASASSGGRNALQRIVIVGSTGSGKTTLGIQLAQCLSCPHVELDALFWGPDWTPSPRDAFRARVIEALAGPRWIVAGNYGQTRDIIWTRADVLVWLDYPLPLVMARLLRRTVARIVTQEELWGGNYETWRAQFASRDSLLLYAVQTYARRRREFAAELAKPEYAHLTAVRFRRPRETEAWLRGLKSSAYS